MHANLTSDEFRHLCSKSETITLANTLNDTENLPGLSKLYKIDVLARFRCHMFPILAKYLACLVNHLISMRLFSSNVNQNKQAHCLETF